MDKGTKSIRIISLLPSTTEIVFALGAGGFVVGVTHECDFPAEATKRRHCTGNLLPPGLSAAEIDSAVALALVNDEHSIYRLDVAAVRELEPDVIITQSLCAVCAVPEKMVQDVSCTLPHDCRVVSSDPHTLKELFGSILSIGKAIGFATSAEKLVERLKRRLETLERSVTVANAKRPKVAVLEWPDPPYAPGHWVPDMIAAVGGICVLGESGEKSRRVSWDSLRETEVDVVICAFCGYDLKKNEEECDKVRGTVEWEQFVGEAEVFATNASAYFSRPGNRLVDGSELLAFMLHGIEKYKPDEGSASKLVNKEWRDLST